MDLQLNSKIFAGLYLSGIVLGYAKQATTEHLQQEGIPFVCL